jgi:two-component system chemotaxis response regulator CheY
MDILSSKQYQELLDFLPTLRNSLKEWQLVDIRLVGGTEKSVPVDQVVQMVHELFRDKEGKIFPCSEREICLLIHWKPEQDPLQIPKKIENKLPAGSCKVVVHEPTPEGLGKLEILFRQEKPVWGVNPFAATRTARRENVVLVADDDMYMRLLVKKGVPEGATVHEVADGNEILETYKKIVPDIVFLDIHMPGRSGMDLLPELKKLDPDAHIIMLSADSSQDNVEHAVAEGAKGFMAKPFTKEKLNEHLKKCPTFS